MSSTITFLYVIQNALSTEPPIRYAIGLQTSNDKDPRLVVALQQGFWVIRDTYSRLPGLQTGGGFDCLFSTETVARDAAAIQLQLALQVDGIETPLHHQFMERPSAVTIREWMSVYNVACGDQLAVHADIGLDDLFIERWIDLALAADEWPRLQWGSAPRITTLTVKAAGTEEVPVDREEAIGVLILADMISSIQTLRREQEMHGMAGLMKVTSPERLREYGGAQQRHRASKYLPQAES